MEMIFSISQNLKNFERRVIGEKRCDYHFVQLSVQSVLTDFYHSHIMCNVAARPYARGDAQVASPTNTEPHRNETQNFENMNDVIQNRANVIFAEITRYCDENPYSVKNRKGSVICTIVTDYNSEIMIADYRERTRKLHFIQKCKPFKVAATFELMMAVDDKMKNYYLDLIVS